MELETYREELFARNDCDTYILGNRVSARSKGNAFHRCSVTPESFAFDASFQCHKMCRIHSTYPIRSPCSRLLQVEMELRGYYIDILSLQIGMSGFRIPNEGVGNREGICNC